MLNSIYCNYLEYLKHYATNKLPSKLQVPWYLLQNKQIINLHVVDRYYATSSCHFDYESRHLGRARAIVGWNFEIIYYHWPDRIYRLSRMRSFPNTNKHRSIDRTTLQLEKLDHKPHSKFDLDR